MYLTRKMEIVDIENVFSDVITISVHHVILRIFGNINKRFIAGSQELQAGRRSSLLRLHKVFLESSENSSWLW